MGSLVGLGARLQTFFEVDIWINRLYDNFCLLYNSLKADKTWEMYLKIELYRKNLLKKVAFQE